MNGNTARHSRKSVNAPAGDWFGMNRREPKNNNRHRRLAPCASTASAAASKQVNEAMDGWIDGHLELSNSQEERKFGVVKLQWIDAFRHPITHCELRISNVVRKHKPEPAATKVIILMSASATKHVRT